MSEWTEERVELLKKLWADGLSATEIEKRLGGVTRNAVLGKINRLGLSNTRKKALTPPPARSSKPAASASPTVRPLVFGNAALKAEPRPRLAAPEQGAEVIPFPVKAEPETEEAPPQPRAEAYQAKPDVLGPGAPDDLVSDFLGGRAVMALTNQTCRWPIGEPRSETFRFCLAEGANFAADRPYCSAHARLASGGCPGPRPRKRGLA